MATLMEGTERAEGEIARASARVLSNSLAGSLWTTISRLSGLAETIAVGVVLGATYLGNSYQSINSLPNIMYYQLLAGSLFASLLVPPLVRHVDAGDTETAHRLAGGFFGVLLTAAIGLAVLLLCAGPIIVRLLTLGVPDAVIAAAQQRVQMILLVLFLPQILLYLVAGASGAVLNAHGRFALAAGAPTLENIGIISTLSVAAMIFGTGVGVGTVTNAELLLLGLGTTGAVGVHAMAVWLGARSTGLTLVPRLGWRDPEVRVVIGRVVPTLAFTGLEAIQVFAIFMVADRLRGGLVAFQLAFSFFILPAAVVTWPIARALLPQLARLHHAAREHAFRDELSRAVRLTSFITVPTALAYLALAVPLARAISFGQLGEPNVVRLIALSLASLAPGVIAESWFILGTYAFYARLDARTPLWSMVVRVGVSVGIMALTWNVHGAAVLPLLGLALSAGSLAGAAHAWLRLRAELPAPSATVTRSSFARIMLVSLVMLVPAVAIALAVSQLGSSQVLEVLAMVGAALAGAGVYFLLQARLHAPEIAWLRTGLAGLGDRTAEADVAEVEGP
jgi:putative peptidoglycan lipid II flippase